MQQIEKQNKTAETREKENVTSNVCTQTDVYERTHTHTYNPARTDGQTSFPRHDMPIPPIKIYGEEVEVKVEVEIGVGVEGVEVLS